jgi:hypothetical protein
MLSLRDLPVVALVAIAAVAFVVGWNNLVPAVPAFDIYMYYQPNMLYAAQRLADGGGGLLWNAWQNCGQPAFGISSTGFLYPANVYYLLLDPDLALRAVLVTNFLIGGLGAYALCRELGTSRAAAICGALAFELGSASIDLNTWGPQMGGAYVWLPWAMWFCERGLRDATLGNAVGLGAVLALALLPGFPQVVFFTYQLIALRVLFELASTRRAWSLRTLALLALGLLLAPLLSAVHLLPGVEMAAQSVRGAALSMSEIQPQGAYTWQFLRSRLSGRIDHFNPLVIVPAMVAGAWWCRAATRRVGAFYLLAAVLYVCLAVGEQTPLFDLYRRLPLGTLFREPGRFTWIASFCLAVLCGLGVDALLRPSARSWARLSAPLAIAGAILALAALDPRHLVATERVLGGAILAGAMMVAIRPAWRLPATVLTAAAVIIGMTLFQPYATVPPRAGGLNLAVRNFPFRQLIDGGVLTSEEDALRRFAGYLTPQDRSYFVHRHQDFSFMPKSGSLFGLSTVQDYEPQPGRRYADFYTMLRSGRPLQSLNQVYFPALGPQDIRRPLLDLSAARFVIIADDGRPPEHFGRPALRPVDVSDDLRLTLYENLSALPRARWVPRAAVVADPAALLQRLAKRVDDPRRVLLLEAPPPSGFLSEDAPGALDAAATVEIVRNQPEHVTLRVDAPQRGFVQLADQFYPGWQATVNDAAAPILRADYLFRAVEVPAGESVVDFRYRPASVGIGAAISAATVAGLVAVTLWRRRRRATSM